MSVQKTTNRQNVVRLGCLWMITGSLLACGVRQGYQQVNTNEPSDYEPSDYADAPKSGAKSSDASAPKAGQTASGERSMNQYDKEATDVVLARAARSVQGNCGDATGSDGKASGPWGKLSIEVVLSPTGRSTGVSVPSPYEGTPSGACIERAFTNLRFPPWHGSDTVVPWEVELVKPEVAEPSKAKGKTKSK